MKINQSLIALACGDSYGSHYEYDGLVGCVFNIKKLPNIPLFPNITDDTKMATILLHHYHKNKTLHTTKLFYEYQNWAIKDGDKDGIGMHTRAVLVNGETNKDSQGNGALMRVIPLGVQLIEDGYSFEEAVELMNADAAITHVNETVFMANRISLDMAVNGIKVLEKEEYIDLLSRLHYGDTAWVIHTLFIVIETLKKDFDFLDGFKYIVSKGGDTDSNCAIYGAIKGYRFDISKQIKISDFLTTKLIWKLDNLDKKNLFI